MKSVMIHVACNDEGGSFAGRAEGVALDNGTLDLVPCGRPPKFAEVGPWIRLAGKRWRIRNSVAAVGNLVWNGYWMTTEDAVRFLVWLHGRRLFSCDGGVAQIADRWDSDRFDLDTVLLTAVLS